MKKFEGRTYQGEQNQEATVNVGLVRKEEFQTTLYELLQFQSSWEDRSGRQAADQMDIFLYTFQEYLEFVSNGGDISEWWKEFETTVEQWNK